MKILVILIALAVTCFCRPVGKTKLKDPKTTRSANDPDGSKWNLSPTTTPEPSEKDVYPGEAAEVLSGDSSDSTSVRWKRSRIKKQAEKDENDVLYHLFDPPQLFSGTEEDIPQTVLDARPGAIVTYKGIQHIWRWKQTREDCFKACVYEPRILCEYYFQYTDTQKCILMVQDYRKFSKPQLMIQTPSQPSKWMRTKKPNIIQKKELKIEPKLTPKQKDETVPELMSNKLDVTVSKKKKKDVDALMPETMPPKLALLEPETMPQKLDALEPETMPQKLDALEPETMPQKLDALVPKTMPQKLDALVPETMPPKLDALVPQTMPPKLDALVPETMPQKLDALVPKTMPQKLDALVSETIPKKLDTHVPETMPEKVDALVPNTMPQKVDAQVPETIPQKLDALVPKTTLVSVLKTTLKPVSSPEAKIVMAVPKVPNIDTESNARNEDFYTLKQMVEKVGVHLDVSLDSLHVETETRDKFMHSLLVKQSHLKKKIQHLQNQMRLIKDIDPHLIKKINYVDNRHKSLVREINNMGKYEHQIVNSLASLDSKIIHIDSTLKNIQESNEHMSKKIGGEERANPKYNRNILALKRDIDDLQLAVKNNPTLIMLTKNQRVLSEALEAFDRQLEVDGKRVTRLHEYAYEWDGRLYKQEEDQKTLSDAFATLSKAIKELRNDVLKLENPQSEVNQEDTKQMRELISDMVIMKKTYTKLQTEASSAQMDLTRLVKDLVNLQVSYHDSKASIMGLVESNKNIKFDYHHMNTDQDQMSNQIQTLATIYKTAVSAMQKLEHKQIQVMEQLKREKNDLRQLSNKSGKKSKQKFQKSPNLLLLTIKKLQTKLLQKFHDLKSDVVKVKKDLHLKHIHTSEVTTTKRLHTKEQGKKVDPAQNLKLVKKLNPFQNNQELRDVKMKTLHKILLGNKFDNIRDEKNR